MTGFGSNRRGLSLLEVIISIAILGVSLAVLGELVRIGGRNAAIARDLRTAQRHCETKLNELAAGVIDPLAGGSEQLDESGEWLCTMSSEAKDDAGLIAIHVVVTQNPEMIARPVSFSLTKWIVDPEVESAAALADVEMAAAQQVAAQQANQPAGSVSPISAGGGMAGGALGGAGGSGGQGNQGNRPGGPGGQGGPNGPGGFGPPGGPGGQSGPRGPGAGMGPNGSGGSPPAGVPNGTGVPNGNRPGAQRGR